jgi:hypothetical protein
MPQTSHAKASTFGELDRSDLSGVNRVADLRVQRRTSPGFDPAPSNCAFMMRQRIDGHQWRWVWAALAVLLPTATHAGAAEAYYLVIYSFQDPSANKDLAHSFASFVRVTSDGPTLDTERGRCEQFTISWLPASLTVKCKKFRSEPGVNLDLQSSLRWGSERGLCLSYWGPYEIQKCLYDDALTKKAELESGCLRYKAIDAACRTAEVSNCIHTLTDLVLRTAGRRLCTPCWGDPASYFVAQACASRMIDPHRTHGWVLRRLGIADEPMTERRLEHGNPNPQPLQRQLQDAIHDRLIGTRLR